MESEIVIPTEQRDGNAEISEDLWDNYFVDSVLSVLFHLVDIFEDLLIVAESEKHTLMTLREDSFEDIDKECPIPAKRTKFELPSTTKDNQMRLIRLKIIDKLIPLLNHSMGLNVVDFTWWNNCDYLEQDYNEETKLDKDVRQLITMSELPEGMINHTKFVMFLLPLARILFNNEWMKAVDKSRGNTYNAVEDEFIHMKINRVASEFGVNVLSKKGLFLFDSYLQQLPMGQAKYQPLLDYILRVVNTPFRKADVKTGVRKTIAYFFPKIFCYDRDPSHPTVIKAGNLYDDSKDWLANYCVKWLRKFGVKVTNVPYFSKDHLTDALSKDESDSDSDLSCYSSAEALGRRIKGSSTEKQSPPRDDVPYGRISDFVEQIVNTDEIGFEYDDADNLDENSRSSFGSAYSPPQFNGYGGDSTYNFYD